MVGRADDDFVLPTLSQFVRDLAEHEAAGDPRAGTLEVTALSFDLPLEIQVTSLAGAVVRIGAAPPTQWVETSVMPVFHRMRLRIDAAEAW